MTRTLLVFGDSNSHGTPPIVTAGEYFRFDAAIRWPRILERALGEGWCVVEEGLPGRTTQFDDPIMGAHMNGQTGLRIALESHGPIDLLVVMLGTNDAKNFHTVARFKKEFGGLLYALRAKWPEARVIWSPVVDMRRVPALPSALGRLLEIRAQLINRKASALCLERGAIPATRLPIVDPLGFSTDGFHASEIGYHAWAEHLYPFVMEETAAEREATLS